MDDNSYVATINFFVFDPTGNGVLMIQNNETLHLTDDNSLKGTGTAFDCLLPLSDSTPPLNGKPCQIDTSGSITFTGKRLIAQGSSN